MRAVDAVGESRLLGTVLEHVAEVTAATAVMQFDRRHAVCQRAIIGGVAAGESRLKRELGRSEGRGLASLGGHPFQLLGQPHLDDGLARNPKAFRLSVE